MTFDQEDESGFKKQSKFEDKQLGFIGLRKRGLKIPNFCRRHKWKSPKAWESSRTKELEDYAAYSSVLNCHARLQA